MRNNVDNPRTFRMEHPNRFRVKKIWWKIDRQWYGESN